MARKKRPAIRDADDVIRDYYEGGESADEGAFRGDGTEPVSTTHAPRTREGRSNEVSGGDVDAGWDQPDGGTESVGGSNPTPDQDIVDDLGKAVGVTYEDAEPLKFGDKVADRDVHRWEMDPASSEDYQLRAAEAAPDAPPPEPDRAPPATGSKRSGSGEAGASKRRKPSGGKRARS